jgi:hypothetical protein
VFDFPRRWWQTNQVEVQPTHNLKRLGIVGGLQVGLFKFVQDKTIDVGLGPACTLFGGRVF